MRPDDRHWTDDDILHHVYGAETISETHLLDCEICRQRVAAVRLNLEAVRAESLCESPQFYNEQRRRIHSALDGSQRQNWSWRLASAMVAVAAMFVVLLNLYKPPVKPTPATIENKVSDAQLYKEISALVEQDEPRVGRPMRALFKEKSQ